MLTTDERNSRSDARDRAQESPVRICTKMYVLKAHHAYSHSCHLFFFLFFVVVFMFVVFSFYAASATGALALQFVEFTARGFLFLYIVLFVFAWKWIRGAFRLFLYFIIIFIFF